jgi:hypothetical protein
MLSHAQHMTKAAEPTYPGLEEAQKALELLDGVVGRVLRRLSITATPNCALAYLRAPWWTKQIPAGVSRGKALRWVPRFETWESAVTAEIQRTPESNQYELRLALFGGTKETAAFQRVIEAETRNSDNIRSTTTFVGHAVRASAFDFVATIEFDNLQIAARPTTHETSARNGSPAEVDLLDAAMFATLLWFNGELMKDSRVNLAFKWDINSILQHAATVVMYKVQSVVCSEILTRDLYAAFNAISSLRYESNECQGEILLARPAAVDHSLALRFSEDVPVESAVWARKLLELSSGGLRLWSEGNTLRGVARVEDPSALTGTFVVRFEGQSSWTLWTAGRPLMSVRHGLPAFPKHIERASFHALFQRIFPQEKSSAAAWAALKALLDGDHGALLIVAEDAAEEAARLSGQGMRIEPTKLSSRDLQRSARIDGAILVDPAGTCHAIGVVLDGQANVFGTRSRGARLNSAVRYVIGTPGRLALVRSEDGSAELLPRLRPQISRTELNLALGRLRGAGKSRESSLREDAELVRLYWDTLEGSEEDRELVLWHSITGRSPVDEDDTVHVPGEFHPHHTDVLDR